MECKIFKLDGRPEMRKETTRFKTRYVKKEVCYCHCQRIQIPYLESGYAKKYRAPINCCVFNYDSTTGTAVLLSLRELKYGIRCRNTFAVPQKIEIAIVILNGLGNSDSSKFRVLQFLVDLICRSSIHKWRVEINNVDNV